MNLKRKSQNAKLQVKTHNLRHHEVLSYQLKF